MMMAGIGGMVGGQVIGRVNDRCGGSQAVAKFNIVAHAVVAGLFLLCNQLDEHNFLCYVTSFAMGFADSSIVI